MKVLIAGAAGQLGRALQETAPADVSCIAPEERRFDLLDPAMLREVIDAAKPDLVVNAAAYTAVDRAEAEEELAYEVNATAAGVLAAEAARLGAGFVHVSTDFIFDGESGRPYAPDAAPNPLNAYGRTKLAGERLVQERHPAPLVVRTAWVHAAGGRNFVATILRLLRERDEVRVVADQIGTPTHAPGLARAIWALAGAGATGTGTTGIWHWTDAGVASWYDFAVAIAEEACALGLVDRKSVVVPIETSAYPTAATRPMMSVLDKSACWRRIGPAAHWREELRIALGRMKETI